MSCSTARGAAPAAAAAPPRAASPRRRPRPRRAAAPEPKNGDSAAARIVALDMALSGTSREDTDRYLAENYDLPDRDGAARRGLRGRGRLGGRAARAGSVCARSPRDRVSTC